MPGGRWNKVSSLAVPACVAPVHAHPFLSSPRPKLRGGRPVRKAWLEHGLGMDHEKPALCSFELETVL